MTKIFNFIFATLWPSFSSFSRSTETHLQLNRRSFLLLESFLDYSFFIFGAFRSAPAPVLVIIVIGGILVILLYGMVIAMLVLVVAAWLVLIFHLIRLVLLFLFFVFLALWVLDFFLDFFVVLVAADNLDLLSDVLIVMDGHDDPAAFLLALDLYFGEDERMVDWYFLVCFEDDLGGMLGSLIDNFSWMIIKCTFFALYIIGEEYEKRVLIVTDEVDDTVAEVERHAFNFNIYFQFSIKMLKGRRHPDLAI